MAFKRLFVSLFICLLLCCSFITGYVSISDYVYADNTTDQWLQVTTNEQLVEAFKYYCKSRDLTIDGSVADGVTKFTTKTFQNACNAIGIDMTALQAHLKYETDGNNGLKFLFDSVGISAYNQIFAQFLQDNDMSVGQQVDNKLAYNGYLYTDDDGYTGLVYVVTQTYSYGGTEDKFEDYVLYEGSNLKYYNYDLVYCYNNNIVPTINAFNRTYNIDVYRVLDKNNNPFYSFTNGLAGYKIFYGSDLKIGTYDILDTSVGYPVAFTIEGSGKVNIGTFTRAHGMYANTRDKYYGSLAQLNTNNVAEDVGDQVTIYYNSTTINNNNYEGDTIINNNGTPNNPDSDPPDYDPYPDGGGTTSNPSNTGGGSGEDDSVITFPDFDFHFPEIDWSLGDLSEKFPFSIPFDLIAFFTVLNAEPQAPSINADIPLGTWYTWHFEADFAQFDNWAVIIRNVEFIAFCVGLIYLTIRLVKG